MKITQTLTTSLKGSYDLVVVGSGVAGICAAVTARRLGVKRLLLIERGVLFGGLATSGLVGYFEPLDDGNGRKLMGGMSQELAELAMRWGYRALDPRWHGFPGHGPQGVRSKFHFSPHLFALALNDLLSREQVEVLMEAMLVDALKDPEGTTLMVETRDGRRAYHALVVIDTTGDAILLSRLGIPTANGSNWFTYMAYQSTLENARRAVEEGSVEHLNQWINAGSNLFGDQQPKDVKPMAGTTAEEVTYLVREGQKRLLEKLKGDDPETRDVTSLPAMPQFRETRRIVGEATLTEAERCHACPTSIGLCPDFYHVGPWYEIPFGTLYNRQDDLVLTAGRSISSSGWAWDVTREIPVAALTGQVAASAAAMMLRAGTGAGGIDISALQKRLSEQGIPLHYA